MCVFTHESSGCSKGRRNISITNITNSPNLSMVSIMDLSQSGENVYSTLDPSRGGIGNILNTKKPVLTTMNIRKKSPGTPALNH